MALHRAINADKTVAPSHEVDMPLLPDDSETCVEKALANKGVDLVKPNETCDFVYCYYGIRLHPLSCPEAFYVNSDGKLAAGESVKKLEQSCSSVNSVNGYGGLNGCSKCLNSLYLFDGDLVLFNQVAVHHRPYECLLLGYSGLKDVDLDKFLGDKPLPDNQVFISVPGDYSRKPPIGDMLLEYAPSYGDPGGIELFARELTAGWCCWGNELLHFQDTKYFVQRRDI